MKILVVDIAASSGGSLTILKEYYERAKKDFKNEYVFLLSDNYLNETNNIKIICLKKYKKWINRLLFDFVLGKKIVSKVKPDKILSLQNTIIHGVKIEQSLYVHQAIPFQKVKKFSLFKKKEYKLAIIQNFIGYLIKLSIKKADSVIVQTNWMKEALIRECKINENKISVQSPKLSILVNNKKNHKKNGKCTFFYPASNALYKNHNVIYKAIDILTEKKINNFEVLLTIDGESTNNIKFLGRIERDEVINKYYNSILLFPSYIETFGLPLLEAKECDSIIIASDTEFSHEILDNYDKVDFFNPYNSNELAELMENKIKKYK